MCNDTVLSILFHWIRFLQSNYIKIRDEINFLIIFNSKSDERYEKCNKSDKIFLDPDFQLKI